MIVLGVTGGVGSGKSTVLQYISENYNADIILTDILAKSMMSSDEKLKAKIKHAFNNDEIFSDSGEIIKDKLATVIFNDKAKLDRLNSIVHPMVKERVNELVYEKKTAGKTDLFLVEAALLLEDNYDKIFDCIYIFADRKVRMSRLSKDRGYSDQKSESIMSNQMPDEEIFKRCKFVINNSGDFNETIKAIDEMLIAKLGLEKKHG